jgi:hypothetical protein
MPLPRKKPGGRSSTVAVSPQVSPRTRSFCRTASCSPDLAPRRARAARVQESRLVLKSGANVHEADEPARSRGRREVTVARRRADFPDRNLRFLRRWTRSEAPTARDRPDRWTSGETSPAHGHQGRRTTERKHAVDPSPNQEPAPRETATAAMDPPAPQALPPEKRRTPWRSGVRLHGWCFQAARRDLPTTGDRRAGTTPRHRRSAPGDRRRVHGPVLELPQPSESCSRSLSSCC